MFIQSVEPEKLLVKITFVFEKEDRFAEYTYYTTWVTLVLKEGRFVYKTRTTVRLPDAQLEAEITRLAKERALEVADKLSL